MGSVRELNQIIEHTLLRANATAAEIEQLCVEAIVHRFHGVCVGPCHVARAHRVLTGSPVRVVSVASFPLGASTPTQAACEAAQSVAQGAAEIDLVIPIGEAVAGSLEAVVHSVATVRTAVPTATLKVILETGHFSPEQLERLAAAVLDAGPEFLKTSTGFGPRGATVDDVALLVRVVGDRAEVKAAGGIRTAAQASALHAAGATRLGTSSGVAIVGGKTAAT